MTDDYDDPDDYEDDYEDHEEVQDERGSRPLATVGEATPALMTLAIKRISTALQHAEEPAIIAKLTDSLMRAMDAYHRYGGGAMDRLGRSASGAGGSMTGKLLVIKRLPTRGSVGRLQLLCDGVGTLLDPEVEMVEQDRERLAKVVELARKADMKGMGESADCRESWAESRDDCGKHHVRHDLEEPPRPTGAETKPPDEATEAEPPTEEPEADVDERITCSCGTVNARGRGHCWGCGQSLVDEGRKVPIIWTPAGDEIDLGYPHY